MKAWALFSFLLCLLLLGGVVWQQQRIRALEKEVARLQLRVAAFSPDAVAQGLRTPASRKGSERPRSRLSRPSGFMPISATVSAGSASGPFSTPPSPITSRLGHADAKSPAPSDAIANTTAISGLPGATGAAPANAQPRLPLTPQRRQELMEGKTPFNPGAIEPSKYMVAANTPLKVGQALQVSYGDTWYAAEVRGLSDDGGVHIHYFGWDDNWDEIVPRSDLRIDPQAKQKAVEQYGRPAGE